MASVPKVKYGSVVLSPMAGFSDSPYRQICREQGSAFTVTEFVPTVHLFHAAPSALRLFRYNKVERPILFQIFGNDPDIIIRAAKRVVPLKPDGIDLNLGCSTRKVSMRGSGAGLLQYPNKIAAIIKGLRETGLPISAKIRLGWGADSRNYNEISHILQEEGVWMVAVHGRTRDMGYSGKADWDAIGEIAATCKVPIFGNGDVSTYDEAQAKIRDYGVYGVHIGRAAVGNPWIFNPRGVSNAEKIKLVERHFQLMCQFYGPAAAILFRKHLTRYVKQVPVLSSVLGECLKSQENTLTAGLLLSAASVFAVA